MRHHSDCHFHVPRMCRKTLWKRSFQCIRPVICNSSSFCQAFVFILLRQNWKPTSSLLHTDLSFSFFSFCQSVTSNACIWCVCVCVCVCACAHVCERSNEQIYPYVFVSAPGSYEMGHHKYSIISSSSNF